MPNWTYNEVWIRTVDDTEKAKNQLNDFYTKTCENTDEEGELLGVDFSGCVPMPKELDIGSVPSLPSNFDPEKAKDELLRAPELGWAEWKRDSVEKQLKMYENRQKLGYESWYDWCAVNWGTKWNACESDNERYGEHIVRLRFNTAWEEPKTWLAQVAGMYPKLSLFCIFHHEGHGDYVDSDGVIANEETHGEDYYDAPGVEWRHHDYTASARWSFGNEEWPMYAATTSPQVLATNFFVPSKEHYDLTDITVADKKKAHDAMISAIQSMIGNIKKEE